jgi:hypothetical protein
MRCQKTKKVRHGTKDGAAIAAKKKSKVAFNVYRCKACGGWHIGHSNSPYRKTARIDELLNQHQRDLERRTNETDK